MLACEYDIRFLHRPRPVWLDRLTTISSSHYGVVPTFLGTYSIGAETLQSTCHNDLWSTTVHRSRRREYKWRECCNWLIDSRLS